MYFRGSFREANMEHRTLKPRENLMDNNKQSIPISSSIPTINGNNNNNNNANIHYQNMKNLQQLVQTIEGYSSQQQQHHHRELDLPPPARILPYSGIKPQDNGIIRPIAFRPLNQSKESSSVSELAIKNRENSRSIGNLAIINSSSSSIAVTTPRQRSSGIPSTSSASNLFPLVTSNSATKITDENDYDTVPEFIERNSDQNQHGGDNYSLIYNFQHHPQQSSTTNLQQHHHHQQQHQHQQHQQLQHHRRAQSGASSAGSGGGGSGSGNGFHYHLTGQSLTSSNSSSTTSGLPNSPPHSSSNGSSVKKSASRHSGIHITPSPSDSGIVDFETLIRDKENELTSVRNAMEQNEEVLVRVYQEKERQYRDQMTDLRQKLQASQQGEAALRQQLRQSDEHRKDLQRGFDNLSDEKQNLQKKCQQIERELYTIRNRFEDFVRDTKKATAAAAAAQQKGFCESCSRNQQNIQQSKPQIIYENGSIASMGTISGKAPIPAPRLSKENNNNNNDRQLRGEVDDLRGEISSLRDQLNTQMQMFAEERRRWEQERKNQSPSPKTQFRNATQEKRTAVLLSNDRLI
uniref:Uncharacterized protein n=1 Tax=Panagrolaimus superbus TaxID=310955 RepID=A0A914YYG7_9BILA